MDPNQQIPLAMMASYMGQPTQAPQGSAYVPQVSPAGALASGMNPMIQAMMMRKMQGQPPATQPPAAVAPAPMVPASPTMAT